MSTKSYIAYVNGNKFFLKNVIILLTTKITAIAVVS